MLLRYFLSYVFPMFSLSPLCLPYFFPFLCLFFIFLCLDLSFPTSILSYVFLKSFLCFPQVFFMSSLLIFFLFRSRLFFYNFSMSSSTSCLVSFSLQFLLATKFSIFFVANSKTLHKTPIICSIVVFFCHNCTSRLSRETQQIICLRLPHHRGEYDAERSYRFQVFTLP